MKRTKSSRVIRLKNAREKKIFKTTSVISFMLLFSFFISLSIKNNLLFLTEMLTVGGILSMTILSNLLSVKQGVY
jgi:hypothetical protein